MTGHGTSVRKHILCVGPATVDHVLEIDAFPTGEGKFAATSGRWAGGGIAPTAAVGISRLGGTATWCGLIGDDRLGQLVLEKLQRAEVTVSPTSIVPGATTPVSVVIVNRRAERWIAFHNGTGLDTNRFTPDIPRMCDVDAVLVPHPGDALTRKVLAQAIEHQVPRVLDVEPGLLDQAADITAMCNHVIFSREGLRTFIGIDEVETAVTQAAHRLPASALGVTLGSSGSAWYVDGHVQWVGAPTVAATDTTGCGDVFHGAYALAIAEGADLMAAVRFATAEAALKAQLGNSWDGMATREQVNQLMKEGWT